MASPVPSLISLEAFESAARHGSFAAAAAELHLSPSAVSHRVRQLERHLGVALFVRHARRIELTDDARAYLPSVRKAFDELAMSTAGLFGPARPAERLTVRAPISYAVAVIAPHLHEFVATSPKVEIRLVSAIWADTVAPDDVDVDIRFGLGDWPGRDAELLHRERAVVVCAEPFAQRHATALGTDDLARLPKVHVLGLEHLWADVLGVSDAGVAEGDTTVDTSLAATELARSGAFAAVVPERFVHRLLADGTLRRLGEPVDMRQAHYVLTPPHHGTNRVSALSFVDWLRRVADKGGAAHAATA